MFAAGTKIDYDIRTYRYHRKEPSKKGVKAKIAAGAILGSALPMIYLAKKQKVNIFKINYGLKEMLLTSTSAIAGGLTAGLIFDKKEHRKKKIDESVFQFMNSTIPTILIAGIYSMTNRIKSLNNKFIKFGGTLIGLIGGMHLAAEISNKINDPFDRVPDRKLSIKDSIANIDDAVGALVLARVPLVKKLQVEKILPAIYSLCGYRSGTSS